MAPALVLTEEKAAQHGYAGAGPFTFSGTFPGVYVPGEPVAISELGFVDEDDARASFESVWEDEDDAPLEWTEVGEGEGLALRYNHAKAEHEAPDEALVEAAVEDVTGSEASSSIRSHKEADAIALELGISFQDGALLKDKVAAIEQVKAGGELAAVTGQLIPADGAEETTPGGDDEEPPA